MASLTNNQEVGHVEREVTMRASLSWFSDLEIRKNQKTFFITIFTTKVLINQKAVRLKLKSFNNRADAVKEYTKIKEFYNFKE